MALTIVVAYLLHALEQFSTTFDGVGAVSPFHYFQGAGVLSGTAPRLTNVTVLLAIGGAGVGIAYARFLRRDL
jgi:hypothetical protein